MESSGLDFIRIENLRCIKKAELQADPRRNIISGANGAGKTSILEAIYLLGRGKTFRSGDNQKLIKSGEAELTLYGEVSQSDVKSRLGLKIGRAGRDIHINGESGQKVSDLAESLPSQVIDPESHLLIQGGPAIRRQYLDWGVFHVKHEFLAAWQKYRKALQQRNAGLKQKQSRQSVEIWNKELISAALDVDRARSEYLGALMPLIQSISADLLQMDVNCIYRQGWAQNEYFPDSLNASWDRDWALGFTQVGPHRAELVIQADGAPARNRLSRGQQKLLSNALVLAQSLYVARVQSRKVILLVDEPAAELDLEHQQKLMAVLDQPELQLFISALESENILGQIPAKKFHVKHGEVSTLI